MKSNDMNCNKIPCQLALTQFDSSQSHLTLTALSPLSSCSPSPQSPLGRTHALSCLASLFFSTFNSTLEARGFCAMQHLFAVAAFPPSSPPSLFYETARRLAFLALRSGRDDCAMHEEQQTEGELMRWQSRCKSRCRLSPRLHL